MTAMASLRPSRQTTSVNSQLPEKRWRGRQRKAKNGEMREFTDRK
jgi:hypothetical protein